MRRAFLTVVTCLLGVLPVQAAPAAAEHRSPGALTGTWIASVAHVPELRGHGFAGTVAVPDDLRLALIVRRRPGGLVQAFVLDPTANIGAIVGTRTVRGSGSAFALARPGRADVPAALRPDGRLVVRLAPLLSPPVVFRRASAAEAREFTAPSADSVPVGAAPPPIGSDGWRTARPDAAGIDVRALSRVVDALGNPPAALRVRHPHAVLIARSGRLVVERYFAGYHRTTPHDLRSAGKSLASLLIGVASERDPALTPRARVLTLLHDLAPADPDQRKKLMTVGDLMSMRSGLACDDDDDASPGNEERMQSQTAQRDWYRYTLALPMVASPGTSAVYCSAGINLLGALVARASREPVAAVFARGLAAPLGIRDYALPLAAGPGRPAYLGGGQHLTPRDFLKFAQLLLDGGRWNGQRVVDPRWVRTIVARRTHVRGEFGDYGYTWHLYTYTVHGRSVRAINAGGNGGQLLFAIPRYDLAIAINAGNYQQYPVWRAYITSTIPAILDAVAGPGAHSRLADR